MNKTLFSRPVRLTSFQVNSIKFVIHGLASGYLALLFYAGINDQLGADPVKALLHSSGIMAVNLLLFTLALSQIARRLPCADIIKLRRMAGVYVFVYALAHFLTWLAFELQFAWQMAGEEIVERPYILVGFAALLILLALTVTSPLFIRKKMRQRWQPLHNTVWAALFLAILHYTWSLKTGWQEPVFYWLVAGILFSLRYVR